MLLLNCMLLLNALALLRIYNMGTISDVDKNGKNQKLIFFIFEGYFSFILMTNSLCRKIHVHCKDLYNIIIKKLTVIS